jgi:iron transport multicopper oxidase
VYGYASLTQLFHCHIEWHLQAGLASILVESPELMQTLMKVPDSVTQTCARQGVKTTGNAAGFDDASTFTGLSHSPGLYPETLTPKGVGALVACIASAVMGLVAIVWFSYES